MSHDAFVKMLDLLRTLLTCDCARSTISCSDPIYPQLAMGGLCYLAGGSCIDICHAYHMSVASIFRCCDIFFNAVNMCPQLENSFLRHQRLLTKQWIIRHCVGAIDGFLCKINCPTVSDCDKNRFHIFQVNISVMAATCRRYVTPVVDSFFCCLGTWLAVVPRNQES